MRVCICVFVKTNLTLQRWKKRGVWILRSNKQRFPFFLQSPLLLNVEFLSGVVSVHNNRFACLPTSCYYELIPFLVWYIGQAQSVVWVFMSIWLVKSQNGQSCHNKSDYLLVGAFFLIVTLSLPLVVSLLGMRVCVWAWMIAIRFDLENCVQFITFVLSFFAFLQKLKYSIPGIPLLVIQFIHSLICFAFLWNVRIGQRSVVGLVVLPLVDLLWWWLSSSLCLLAALIS